MHDEPLWTLTYISDTAHMVYFALIKRYKGLSSRYIVLLVRSLSCSFVLKTMVLLDPTLLVSNENHGVQVREPVHQDRSLPVDAGIPY